MDIAAISELQARAREATASAEKYRALARGEDFYHAVAVTYGRVAREIALMLDAVERASVGLAAAGSRMTPGAATQVACDVRPRNQPPRRASYRKVA